MLLKLRISNNKLPDVMSAIARAQNSCAAAKAKNEVAGIGEFVCNGSAAEKVERGILKYATIATKLDMKLLEQVREDICLGMDAFESAESMKLKSKINNQVRYPFELV